MSFPLTRKIQLIYFTQMYFSTKMATKKNKILMDNPTYNNSEIHCESLLN